MCLINQNILFLIKIILKDFDLLKVCNDNNREVTKDHHIYKIVVEWLTLIENIVIPELYIYHRS